MPDMLSVALKCIARGWRVFPCKPKGKEPLTHGGFKAARNDETAIRHWWVKWPDANVGIATAASGLTVLDIDDGITDRESLLLFCSHVGLPRTYAVRTGRRPGFGVQLYFQGGDLKSIAWNDESEGVSGDVRSGSGYVLAEGSYHPSGAFYEALVEAPIAPAPDFVKRLEPANRAVLLGGTNPAVIDDGGPITAARNVTMISLLGRYRNGGHDDDQLREYAIDLNASRFDPPLGEDELERLITNACKFPIPEVAPTVMLGGKIAAPATATPAHWTAKYHTAEEVANVPPPRFLIDGFLLADSITGLAAPVGQRKSLISLNVAHALCTGESLFGHFKVASKPSRVLYLCPEMGLASFANRLKLIGLGDYVGKTFFCTTMNSAHVALDDLTEEELAGAVVIIDTAVRFLEGDEDSSDDMKKFAASIFRLKALGGPDGAIILLHHSPKSTKEATELSLENSMRGSGELGAFLTSCWATKIQDPQNPYQSASYLSNVKQRDFESGAFEVTSGTDCRLHMVDQPAGTAVIQQKAKFVADADGKEAAAIAIIRENMTDSISAILRRLDDAGIKRGRTWISNRRADLKGGPVSD